MKRIIPLHCESPPTLVNFSTLFTVKNITMKTYLLLLSVLLLTAMQCRKPANPIVTDIRGLPPATQTGANTIGFLLNGQPWTPEGNNGTANLSIDYDPGINNGGFGISAYRIISQSNSTFLGIGIIDSLNLLKAPFTRRLNRISLARAGFSDFNSCTLFSSYDSVWSEGEISISKLDRNQRIISGTFNVYLFQNGCDTIKATNGRFDMKF